MRKERRTTPRVPFVACAAITEAGTNVSIGARISDISQGRLLRGFAFRAARRNISSN